MRRKQSVEKLTSGRRFNLNVSYQRENNRPTQMPRAVLTRKSERPFAQEEGEAGGVRTPCTGPADERCWKSETTKTLLERGGDESRDKVSVRHPAKKKNGCQGRQRHRDDEAPPMVGLMFESVQERGRCKEAGRSTASWRARRRHRTLATTQDAQQTTTITHPPTCAKKTGVELFESLKREFAQ